MLPASRPTANSPNSIAAATAGWPGKPPARSSPPCSPSRSAALDDERPCAHPLERGHLKPVRSRRGGDPVERGEVAAVVVAADGRGAVRGEQHRDRVPEVV